MYLKHYKKNKKIVDVKKKEKKIRVSHEIGIKGYLG